MKTYNIFISHSWAYGDAFFTLVIYFIIGLLKNDFKWVARLNKKEILILAVIGFSYATGIEWRALFLQKWSYSGAMPIIPYFEVGLAPVLEMTILLPLSFYLTKLSEKYIAAAALKFKK